VEKQLRNLCYTLLMSEDQRNWIAWARVLQRWGINDVTASLLESAGSLGMLFAQVLYISQPLLSGTIFSRSIQAFAQVLENPISRKELASFLRKASSSGTGA
jgi:hypothetical protein